jgi:hypothetical protein
MPCHPGLPIYMAQHTTELLDLIRQIFSTSLPGLPVPFAPGSLRLLTVMWFDDLSGFGLRRLLQCTVQGWRALSRRVSSRLHSPRVSFADGVYEEWPLLPSIRGRGTSPSQASESSTTLTQDAPITPLERARTALPRRRQSDRATPASSASAWGLQSLALPS